VYLLYQRKNRLDDPKTASLFGSLYLAYERPFWYWESIEMIKKMILAGGLVIVAAGSSAQVLIGVLVSLTYLLIVVRLEPFDDIVDDRLQMIASLQILLNLLIGLVLKLDEKGEYESHVVGALLVLMNAAVVVLSLVLSLMAFPTCTRKGLLENILACKKRCTVKHAKSAIQAKALAAQNWKAEKTKKGHLARLVKALEASLKGDSLKRGIELAVRVSKEPMAFNDTKRQWNSVAQNIPSKSRRRKVLNLFKLLYTSSRLPPTSTTIELEQWNNNPMAKKKRQSMWRLCTDEKTGKTYYFNDTTKERRFSIPVQKQVIV
jgi:hypothetical protein